MNRLEKLTQISLAAGRACDSILSACESDTFSGSMTCGEAGAIAELFGDLDRADDMHLFLEMHGDCDDDPEDVHVGYRYRALMSWDEGVTLESTNVLIAAEHRRSRGEVGIHGPYSDGFAARWRAVTMFETGAFDPDGCEVTFKRARQ